VLILILLDTPRHLFRETRPIDWLTLVVEILVLILIAYEVAKPLVRQFKVKRRIDVILRCVAEGVQLQREGIGLTSADLERWKENLQAWCNTTCEKVNRKSP
jgi:hypothetical protein